MTYALKNERETLAIVAKMLRGEIPAPVINGEAVRYHQGAYCGKGHDWNGQDCGTTACIGGHAWLVENPNDTKGADAHVRAYDRDLEDGDHELIEASPGLSQLYWGRMYATPTEGAAAIDNYLRSGNPNWHNINVW